MLCCPRDSHNLVERRSGDKSVWCCNICGGGFTVLGLKIAVAEGSSVPRAVWDREIFCPRDKTRMHLFHHRHVALDVCPKCFGTWLDGDEIGKILGPAFADGEPKPAKRPPVNLAECDEVAFGAFHRGLEDALFEIFSDP